MSMQFKVISNKTGAVMGLRFFYANRSGQATIKSNKKKAEGNDTI